MATASAAYVASRAAVGVTLAASAGAAAAAGLDVALRRHIDHRPALDGALAGLVAVSAGACALRVAGACRQRIMWGVCVLEDGLQLLPCQLQCLRQAV